MGTGTATRPHVRSFERFLRGRLESFDEFASSRSGSSSKMTG
jgi:hypothetical protein